MIRVAEAFTINEVGNHTLVGSEVRNWGEQEREMLLDPLGGLWKGKEELRAGAKLRHCHLSCACPL